MDLKKTLPVALIALLAPFAAFADHEEGYTVVSHDNLWEGPTPPPSEQGRYELRPVQRWVPGRYEQVWVPEQCHSRQKWYGTKVRCRGGYYDSRWVPGHYETVQEWVWVPYRPRPTWRVRTYDDKPYHHATPPVSPTAM